MQFVFLRAASDQRDVSLWQVARKRRGQRSQMREASDVTRLTRLQGAIAACFSIIKECLGYEALSLAHGTR